MPAVRSRLTLLVSVVVLVGRASDAQTPDTTAAERYFPLAVGNEWHTSGSRSNGYWTEYTQVRNVVQSEQLDAPGRFVVEWIQQFRQFPNSPVVTTSGTSVWTFDEVMQQAVGGPMPETECPLGAPFGMPVACGSGGATYAVTGGHSQSVTVGPESVVTTRKRFYRGGSGPGYIFSTEYEYAAGIGQTAYRQSSANSTDSQSDTWVLSYARVGGEEYGQRLTFPTAGEAGSVAGALALSVAPNPAVSATTVRFTLAEQGPVRLTVTDMLGREVAVFLDGMTPAGPSEVQIPVSRLTAGIYLVRILGPRSVAAAQFTVVR